MPKAALIEATRDECTRQVDRVKALVEASRVEEARELIRDAEAKWPENSRVRYWASVLAPPRLIGVRPASGREMATDWGWLKEHADEYRGCWVAVHNGELLAANPKLRVVHEAVLACPDRKEPLVHFIPDLGQ